MTHRQGSWSLPTVWNTYEVEKALSTLREACNQQCDDDPTVEQVAIGEPEDHETLLRIGVPA